MTIKEYKAMIDNAQTYDELKQIIDIATGDFKITDNEFDILADYAVDRNRIV